MNYRAYPKYKSSGVEWLGDVPEHWDVKRLKYSFELLTTKTENHTNPIALENIESWTGRLIVTETEFDGEGIAFVKDDILFGKLRPYLAKVLKAELPGEAVGDFFVMRPQQSMNSGYAAFSLRSEDFINIIDGSTFGSKMPRASWEFMGGVKITLPQLPEQRAIATFLDRETGRIDTLVAKKVRLIELLREKRSALISHAVTKGLDPSVKMKPSGVEWLGDVPEHWEVKRCGTAYNIQLGKMLQPDASSAEDIPMPYFKALHVQWGKVTREDLPTMWASVNDAKKYSVSNGDLLVCEGGEVGRAAILKNYCENAIIQNSLHRVRSNGVNSLLYLMCVIIEAASRQWFEILCNKATIAHFTGEKFAALRVPFPPLHEQEAIAAFLDRETRKIDALIAKVDAAISKLKEYRTALISAAVTGKIDVREAA